MRELTQENVTLTSSLRAERMSKYNINAVYSSSDVHVFLSDLMECTGELELKKQQIEMCKEREMAMDMTFKKVMADNALLVAAKQEAGKMSAYYHNAYMYIKNEKL